MEMNLNKLIYLYVDMNICNVEAVCHVHGEADIRAHAKWTFMSLSASIQCLQVGASVHSCK